MRKKLRKPLAVLLAVMLVAALWCSALAADPTFKPSSATGKPGDDVTITISAENNPGIASFLLKIAYDKNALTFKSIALGSAYTGGTPIVNDNPDDLRLGMITISGDISDTTLGTVVFTINPDAAGGDHSITLSYDEDDVYNANEDNVLFKTEAGKVTVQKSVTGVSLDKPSLALSVGGSETLTATVTPSDATDATVSWSSNNTSIATVANGVVSAKSEGTAVITATAGGKEAKCTVTISKDPLIGSVAIDGSAKFGATLTANVTGAPADATLAYSWQREGSTASIGNTKNYTLVSADIGKKISVVVTDGAAKYSGSLTAQTAPQLPQPRRSITRMPPALP